MRSLKLDIIEETNKGFAFFFLGVVVTNVYNESKSVSYKEITYKSTARDEANWLEIMFKVTLAHLKSIPVTAICLPTCIYLKRISDNKLISLRVFIADPDLNKKKKI